MSQFERDLQNARIAERKKAAKEKNKPVVVARPESLGTMCGGTRLSPDVVAARNKMNAAKQTEQENEARESRLTGIAQDAASVAALVRGWIEQTPAFVPTEFNNQSLTNCVQVALYNHGALSYANLNEIFEYLLEHNHLERSGHARVRGQGGIMVGRPTIYPEFRSPAEKALDAQVQVRSSAPQTSSDDISTTEARRMPLPELTARVHAMRKDAAQPQAPTANISEAEAKDMPLVDLKKIVQAGYNKGRR